MSIVKSPDMAMGVGTLTGEGTESLQTDKKQEVWRTGGRPFWGQGTRSINPEGHVIRVSEKKTSPSLVGTAKESGNTLPAIVLS